MKHEKPALWTPVMLALLRKWYPIHSTEVVAGALELSVGQIYRKAASLGVKKSAEYLATEDAGRIQRGKQHPSMVAAQFKKGLVPWNKGTHYVAGGRSEETRFKPGRAASEARNYLPIGSLRVAKDGVLERKVTDDPAIVPARRWVAVQRLVWMEVNGEIPAGHAVVFKPGRRTTVVEEITIDAIELITRQELMRRNSFHTNYPPEVRKLIQLKGAIKRQVNRRIRESQESST